MYIPRKGGTKETIQGVTCYIPKKPAKTDILFYHLPKKEQHWYRTVLPTYKAIDIDWFFEEPEDPMKEISWDEARRQEIIGETGCDPWNLDKQDHPKAVKGLNPDKDYFSETLDSFREQEYSRVDNGVWFMNDGKATYITGTYYFFLNYWKMDVGYAQYRNPDRQKFYLMEYTKQSPNDFGMVDIESRGCGKSVQAACVAYIETVRKKNAIIGIQSKTEADAEDFFNDILVPSYQDLPDFWIPINKHGSSPVKKLDFSAPSKQGKSAAANRKLQTEALRSILGYKNSKETAYDGTTLSFLIQDEIGKTTESNVYSRWKINRKCLHRDGRKRGWCLLTTTVEEMEKGGGEACKELWEKSNPSERNENGRTVSWCIRYFRPASLTTRFDEYGFPDVKANLAEHAAEKKTLESDPDDYISYIQKVPETIAEAFASSSGNCPYNAAILQKAQIRLIMPNHGLTVKGDFTWAKDKEGKPKKDTKVEFIRNDVNGMWEISWMDMKAGETNVLINDGELIGINGETVTQWKVKKNGKRFAAYDPYSAKKTVFKSKQSDAACAVYQNYDYHIPEEYTNTFIADFAGRYPNPDDAHEQVIMAAVFFGLDVLVESNKLGGIEYINKRGYSSILMERPSATGTKDHYRGIQGIPSNQNTIDYYVGETRADINVNGLKNKHLRIVQDWLGFDPTNTTKYDSGVAASLAIVASKSPVEQDESSDIVITDLFPTTNQRGTHGNYN